LLILITISLILLLFINLYISKSYTYPPVVFTGIWAVYLFVLLIAGDMFYDLSTETLAIYYFGAVLFSIGGIISFIIPVRNISNKKSRKIERDQFISYAIKISIVILIIGLPFYWKKITDLYIQSGLNDFWYAVRRQTIINSQTSEYAFNLVNNLVPFSIIIGLVSYYEYKMTNSYKIRTIIAVILALVYNLMTGGRSGAISFIFSLIGMELITTKKINFKRLFLFIIILLIVAGSIAVVIEKGDASKSKSIIENIPALEKDLVFYGVGGVVGFNHIVKDRNIIPSNGGVARFFLQTANNFGANYNIPSLHMDYLSISDNMSTNVYTIYGYYYHDYGWPGVIFFMIFIGIMLTWIYRNAKYGKFVYIILYSYLFSGMLLSSHSEHFISSLNFIIKMLIVIIFIYDLPLIKLNIRIKKEITC